MPRVLKTLASEGEITSLWWSDLGLIAGDLSGEVSLWPTDNSTDGGLCHLGEPVHRPIHTLAVTSVCSIGPLIISCSLDGSIFQWDCSETSKPLSTTISDPFQVFPLISDNVILIGTVSGVAVFYSMTDESIVNSVQLFSTPIVKFAIHPTARQFFALTQKELAIVEIDGGIVVNKVVVSAGCCTCCAVSGDGYSCAISTTEGAARILDVVSFVEVGSIFFEESELNAIAAYDYGKHFVVTSVDGRIGLFDLRKMVKEPGLKVGKKPLIALSVNGEIGKASVAGCETPITIIDFE
jgi:WD40 repeat protein